MRIISQDRALDIPYEGCIIFYSELLYDGNAIYVQSIGGNTEVNLLGKYASKEKALEVMKMLREAWLKESVEFENGIYHRNTVFQFPQDDEV